MKVTHIMTTTSGGAAKAAIRLHLGLLKIGVDSNILTLSNNLKIPNVVVYDESHLDLFKKIKNKFVRALGEFRISEKSEQNLTKELYSTPRTKYSIYNHPLIKSSDIINFHWISGFIDYKEFSLIDKSKFWTLHDMNPFTGGCHYSYDCRNYIENCEECSQILKSQYNKISKENLNYKFNNLIKDLHIISPSKWLATCSYESRLFRDLDFSVISYGLDEEKFKYRDKSTSRAILGLPLDKKIILFVADSIGEKRKNFKLIIDFVEQNRAENYYYLAVGDKKSDFNSKIQYTGFISDELLMSFYYNSADAFVIPSLADNFPNTVLESLMCGTPVVGFRIGGISEQLDNFGFGTELKDGADGLMAKLLFVSNYDNEKRESIAAQSHLMYSSQIQAENYLKLYEKNV